MITILQPFPLGFPSRAGQPSPPPLRGRAGQPGPAEASPRARAAAQQRCQCPMAAEPGLAQPVVGPAPPPGPLP